jgi:hypothetical protein
MTMGGRVKDVYMNGNYVCIHGKDIHAWMKHDGLTVQTHERMKIIDDLQL